MLLTMPTRLEAAPSPDRLFGRGILVLLASWMLGASPGTVIGADHHGGSKGVTFTQQDGRIRIEIDGQHLTDYVHAGAPHVYYYPLFGPDGVALTRNAPMKQVEGEDRDHPHHRSLWFSHGDINGIDFWAETPKSGHIVHDRVLEMKGGAKSGVLTTSHRWVAPDGSVTCTDVTTLTVHNRSDGVRMLDFDVTVKAPKDKAIVFGDTKEGTMAIRLAETMRLKPNEFNKGKPVGKITQSTGVKDGDTWGKRAAWCDYSGPVAGRTMGVAIFDHPDNLRHPTWWHVRDYGLFGANPFGIHDFEKKAKGTGDFKVAAGGSLRFRYRLLLHRGDGQELKLADEFAAFAATKSRAKR